MNQLPLSSSEINDELNWLAFRYVAEELTEAESYAFEARLRDDLAACEAVAAMSQVSGCVQLAAAAELSQPVRKVEDPRSLPGRFRAWLAVGSTAVALGWLFLLLGNSNDRADLESPDVTVNNDSQSAADLIARWSQSDGASGFSDELLEITPLELSEADDSDRPQIPGWMIAAVSLEKVQSLTDDMTDMPSKLNNAETKDN